ncbi:WD40 repeat domain-containing protein [Corallococcus llansteffanensis]|uniref:WD40 repeat domain-containing protein n=1 Tax=Corallococcus llansteffanensis TaxID=2316731 RepID=UPI0011C3A9AD|nr:WD40 repeat domain-containing protein [Corallococcus llansteffanensis]
MGRRAVQQGSEVYATRSVDLSRDGQAVLIARHAVNAPERLELRAWDDLRVLEHWGAQLAADATFARFASEDDRLVVTDFQRNTVLLDRGTGGRVQPLRPGTRGVSVARHAPRAAVLGAQVEVLDTTDGRSVWTVGESHPSLKAEAVALSPDGKRLAVTGWDGGQVALLDVDSRSLVKVLEPWSVRGTQLLALDAPGHYLSLVGTGGSAAWVLANARRAAPEELGPERTAYTCHAFHPRLPIVVLGSRAGYVTSIDLETGACRYAEKVHEGRVWDVAVSEDGARVVSAGDEGDVYLQEWAEMEALGTSRVS